MQNGEIGGVSGGNNISWNQKLAQELDAADGKKDGKISASIWNSFMNHTGSSGNKIKNFININNAAKSLNYYDTKKDAGKVDWDNWESMYESFTDNKDASGAQETTVKPEVSSPVSATDDGIEVPAAANNAPEKPQQASSLQQADFENALKENKFMDSFSDINTFLNEGGFGKNETGLQDENGLYYELDKNSGKTYINDNGERIRICNMDAMFVTPGGTAVSYSNGKGNSNKVFYDKDGNPVQGKLIVKQDNGSFITYDYKYESGKPVLLSDETAVKPNSARVLSNEQFSEMCDELDSVNDCCGDNLETSLSVAEKYSSILDNALTPEQQTKADSLYQKFLDSPISSFEDGFLGVVYKKGGFIMNSPDAADKLNPVASTVSKFIVAGKDRYETLLNGKDYNSVIDEVSKNKLSFNKDDWSFLISYKFLLDTLTGNSD